MNETLADVTTPEPMPVMQSYERCPIHNFRFISMPRDSREGYHGLLEKCPLRACKEGR
jgi:hypothetical protein